MLNLFQHLTISINFIEILKQVQDDLLFIAYLYYCFNLVNLYCRGRSVYRLFPYWTARCTIPTNSLNQSYQINYVTYNSDLPFLTNLGLVTSTSSSLPRILTLGLPPSFGM